MTAPSGVQTTLSYSATPSATVCTVDSSTGALTPVEVGACVITATAAGTADWNQATATFTVTVAAAGALALTLDTIAGDDTVNIAEKAAGFTISGDTGSEGGVSCQRHPWLAVAADRDLGQLAVPGRWPCRRMRPTSPAPAWR